jgi:hypothetical protein
VRTRRRRTVPAVLLLALATAGCGVGTVPAADFQRSAPIIVDPARDARSLILQGPGPALAAVRAQAGEEALDLTVDHERLVVEVPADRAGEIDTWQYEDGAVSGPFPGVDAGDRPFALRDVAFDRLPDMAREAVAASALRGPAVTRITVDYDERDERVEIRLLVRGAVGSELAVFTGDGTPVPPPGAPGDGG